MKVKSSFLSILISLFFLSVNSQFLKAESYSSQQMIPAGHWVYDAFQMLCNSVKMTSFAVDTPITVGELRMYFDRIPYESLSSSGKELHQKIFDYLTEKKKTFQMGSVFFAFNARVNPEFMIKTNYDIDWTYATDYTGHLNSVEEYPVISSVEHIQKLGINEYNYLFIDKIDGKISRENKKYAAASNFYGSNGYKSFIELPLYLGWSDYFFIQTDPCYAKSIWGMSANSNFTNISYSSVDVDFLWPRTAYGSFGRTFSDWGVNFNVARTGLQIGKTQTGSIIYNSTFETDCYFQLNLYSPRLKYNLDVVQISSNKYMYLHSIETRPFFDFVRINVVEGTLIQQPFELRFLNPLMIMHSFSAWEDYSDVMEKRIYGESHVAAYMGIQVEAIPVKNMRLYLLYAQNEIQSEIEKSSFNGNAMPDSLGGQLGMELTIPDNRHNGWWTGTLEGIYTTPYLYLKQGKDWSLYSERYNMQSDSDYPICSWIGTPFGPDALGFQARIGYSKIRKWNAEIDYLFVAHGTNSFGLFDNTVEINGETYYAYYPSVLYRLGLLGYADAANVARDYKLTGTIQYTNQVTLKGAYVINKHLELNGQGIYSFIFNNKNEPGDFQHGFEFSVALEYTVF